MSYDAVADYVNEALIDVARLDNDLDSAKIYLGRLEEKGIDVDRFARLIEGQTLASKGISYGLRELYVELHALAEQEVQA